MKITAEQFATIKSMVETFMADPATWADGKPKSVDVVQTGSQAWGVAHRAGVTEYCYGNTAKDMPGIEGVCDAHIKTALARIFPNAVFKDNYTY